MLLFLAPIGAVTTLALTRLRIGGIALIVGGAIAAAFLPHPFAIAALAAPPMLLAVFALWLARADR